MEKGGTGAADDREGHAERGGEVGAGTAGGGVEGKFAAQVREACAGGGGTCEGTWVGEKDVGEVFEVKAAGRGTVMFISLLPTIS